MLVVGEIGRESLPFNFSWLLQLLIISSIVNGVQLLNCTIP